MLTVLSDLIGLLVNVTSSVIGLLPSVDIATLGIEPSEGVRNVLGAVNYFIPLQQIIVILGVWASLVIVVNVVFMVQGIAGKTIKS